MASYPGAPTPNEGVVCGKRPSDAKSGSIDVIKDCLSCFVIDLPSCVCKKDKGLVHIALQFHSEQFLQIQQ